MLVEGSADEAALAKLILEEGLEGATLRALSEPLTLGRALARGGWDGLVVASPLPWGAAEDVILAAREENPGLAVVALVDPTDPLLEAQVWRAGAGRVLPKTASGWLGLPRAVEEALAGVAEENELRRLETRLQTLLEQAEVGFFRASLEGEILEANGTLLRLLGIERLADAAALELPSPYFRRHSRSELLAHLDESGALHQRELQLPRSDGGLTWVALTERLCLDRDGDLVVDGLLIDLTDRKQDEDELARRATALDRSNRDLERFAAVASHELREPLRTVARHCELLTEDVGARLSREARESLGFVRQGVERMQTLVDDLLALSRLEAREHAPETVSLEEVLAETLEDLADAVEDSDAELEWQSLPAVWADPAQLRILVHNLLSNAIKFRAESAPRIRVTAQQRQDDCEVAVADNGIGVDPQRQQEIFEPFRRLHPEFPGSGLGLALCRKIVERHRGRLWVESPPGGGSVFRFTLPAASPRGRTDAVSEEPAEAAAPSSARSP